MCVSLELISKDKGFRYLESLKPMIKDEHMFYIKSKIMGDRYITCWYDEINRR